MRRKKAEEQGPVAAGGDTRIQPMDVQQVEFRLAFRGYNERDVDAFLDRITEDLSSYIEENELLRSGTGAAPLAAGVGVAEDARAEAEEIIAKAREDAATITRDAEVRAAVAGAPSGDARAAVAPFLNKEREFLQSLGSLVQGHAEEIKEMVLAVRARTETAAAAAASVAPAEAPEVSPPTSNPEPAVASTTDDPTSGDEAVAGAPDAEASDDAFAPIRVPASEETTTEAESGADPAETPTPAPAGLRRDSGERSLRELFWGED
jgi:DivIVA domain-containing protein